MAIITNNDKELVKKTATQQPANGMSATAGTGVEDYSGYLKEMNAAKQRAAVAGLEAAYQKNVAAIDRAKESAAVEHQAARNQTAGASEQAKRNFAQYAAANGLNSGAGGQAELARSVTLQNNLNAINQQEADAVADLDLQRAQTEIDYNNAIAQAQAEGDYELADALYQEKIRVQDATREEARYREQFDYTKERDAVANSQWQQSFDQNKAQREYENLFNEQKYADSQAQQQWQNNFYEQQRADNLAQQEYENLFAEQQRKDNLAQQQWQNAFNQQQFDQGVAQQGYENQVVAQETLAGYGQAYLQAGVMPSAEMLTAMGITEADAQAYIATVQNANAGTQMNLTTAKQAAENGVFNDQVIAVLKENGYSDDMLAGIYGYEAEPAETKGMNFARYLYTSTKNPDYVYRTLKSSGYSDTEIDGLMAQLGL